MSVDHDSIKANDLFVEGKRLHDEGKYEEAVASFDKAIEIKPEFADVWNSKGEALRALKKYEEAIASYDKAIETDPKNADACVNKGFVLARKLHRHNDAIASFDKAIEIDPKNADAWNHKGNAIYYFSRFDDAIVCYDKATEIDPKEAYYYYNKGNALQELKKYEEAIASYDKAIEIDSQFADAWQTKAFALRKLERYDDAIVCYDKAIKADPENAAAWKGMRITLKKLGCPEYDTRCASCDHYPWTDVFISTMHTAHDDPPSWREDDQRDIYTKKKLRYEGYPTTGRYSVSHNQYKCKCECHNVPTIKKLMRFSLKRKVGSGSRHVMHVEKLAVCPFCKRSEFEDTVYDKINGMRSELLAEDAKATGAPEREYHFDYNRSYLVHGKNTSSSYRTVELTPCAGNHKHEWYKCKCGREICKISFRNYFGYEIDEDLFDNDLVDKSHYSKRTKALLGYTPDEERGTPVPVYATMETIEKVWGKMPMYRDNPYSFGWGSSSDFIHYYENETTRPKPLGVFDISGTPEHLRSIYLIAKKEHEEKLDREFMYEVYGIGDTTADKLLEKIGTADKVFSPTAEEIAKISDISEDRARRIRKKLDRHAKTRGQEYRDKKREDALLELKKYSFNYFYEENSS